MTETVPGRISSMSSRAMRASWSATGREDDLVGGVLAEKAVEDLAVLGRDDDRLEAPHEAGAGEEDRLEQVALGADLADLGQVGADLAAEVADRVAGDAGRLGAVEDRLAAADVAAGRASPGTPPACAFCPAASAFERRVQSLPASVWTFAAELRQPRLERLDPQAGPGRRLLQGRDAASARPPRRGDCSKAASRRSTSSGPAALDRVGQGERAARSSASPSTARRRRALRIATGRSGASSLEQEGQQGRGATSARPPGTAASASSRTSAGVASRLADLEQGRGECPRARPSGSAGLGSSRSAWRARSASSPARTSTRPGHPRRRGFASDPTRAIARSAIRSASARGGRVAQTARPASPGSASEWASRAS